MLICEEAILRKGNQIMGKKDKKDKKVTKDIEKKKQTPEVKLAQKRPISTQVLTCVLSGVIVFALTEIPNLFIIYGALPQTVAELKSTVGEINKKVDSLTVSMSAISIRVKDIENRLDNNRSYSQNYQEFELNSTAVHNLAVTKESGIYQLSTPTWNSSDFIATNASTGKEYTVEDLEDQNLVLTYKIDNEESIFYGKFNEKNHWDGNCIINTYKNGKLKLIMDAEYDDGKVISYKQVFSFETKAGRKVWGVSDRKNEGTLNSGESWNYVYGQGFKMNFDYESATAQDIISVSQFRELMGSRPGKDIEGYYFGNTSDGSYNDNTGNAYLVKYAEDGTVRTLYRGKFKDGAFNDDTGSSWYITKDKDTSYMYYKGFFEDNKALYESRGGEFINPLTKEKRESIIKGLEFKCELNWYDDVKKEYQS